MRFLNIHQRMYMYFRTHRIVSIVAGHLVVMVVLALSWSSGAFAPGLFGALAQTTCARSDQAYIVHGGDTLSGIASHYGVTWQQLSTYNKIPLPNLIYPGQHLCIQGHGGGNITRMTTGQMVNSPQAVTGVNNPFAYGQCTWWASQRYFQLHGVYVPWRTNSNAWQWSARAYDFHWIVSSQPSNGAIIDLQAGVQGAGTLGHVAVVEKILGNGYVIASSMNWGPNYSQVTDFEFRPGPGVTFIQV